MVRYSKQHKLILDILKGRKDHPTADDVYVAARAADPNISLGTVYRNLKQLSSCGEVDTLETTDRSLHYDGDVSPHDHFICTVCGKIYDGPSDNSRSAYFTEKGFKTVGKKCVYYGVCDICIKKEK